MASNQSESESDSGDVIYDAFYSGAIGGSMVALFFLVIDALDGQPLFTPSLMGSVLFSGTAAASVEGVRLDMVAYYSLVHFLTFGALGALIAFLVHEVELHARHPAIVLLLLFLLFEGSFALVAAVLMPGVTARLGAVSVAAANLLAASGIGVFLLLSHRPEVWQKLRRARSH